MTKHCRKQFLSLCSGNQRDCQSGFAGNTMTQHAPGGALLFLHANLSPKWSLQVPGDFAAYTRRCARSGDG